MKAMGTTKARSRRTHVPKMVIGYADRKLPPYVKALVISDASAVQKQMEANITQTAPNRTAPDSKVEISIPTLATVTSILAAATATTRTVAACRILPIRRS